MLLRKLFVLLGTLFDHDSPLPRRKRTTTFRNFEHSSRSKTHLPYHTYVLNEYLMARMQLSLNKILVDCCFPRNLLSCMQLRPNAALKNKVFVLFCWCKKKIVLLAKDFWLHLFASRKTKLRLICFVWAPFVEWSIFLKQLQKEEAKKSPILFDIEN